MSCETCSISGGGKPRGCQSNGGCSTGGCNKLNTYDWLTTSEYEDPTASDLVEVSFRNGAIKQFFHLQHPLQAETRDVVVVEADGGYDVGEISLKGDLVLLQMKKKKVNPEGSYKYVQRIANEQDLEKVRQAISRDKSALVRARAIARTLALEMKIGEIIFRADQKKAIFFYTADGRVDFRELIRHFAKEFRVKVEMKQIGARQESGLIGGLGSCGRELCCSTWLTHFHSVSTSAARYQNLAINQAKLSGQCGRLKCCLNYELDVYIEALEAFPNRAETLQHVGGYAKLFKTDIFKKIMYYLVKDERGRSNLIALTVDHVISLQKEIKEGKIPQKITGTVIEQFDKEELQDEELTGHIELKPDPPRRKKNKPRERPGQGDNTRSDTRGRRERPERNQSMRNDPNNPTQRSNSEDGPRENRDKQRPGNNQRDNRPDNREKRFTSGQGQNKPAGQGQNKPAGQDQNKPTGQDQNNNDSTSNNNPENKDRNRSRGNSERRPDSRRSGDRNPRSNRPNRSEKPNNGDDAKPPRNRDDSPPTTD